MKALNATSVSIRVMAGKAVSPCPEPSKLIVAMTKVRVVSGLSQVTDWRVTPWMWVVGVGI
jgi:hypothetical protein